ncbi:hypothetical protein D9615_000973 [Tricholomella constricta]|uniref:Uncharacterized protein n=1 Tax=Tricholomella constricta TaxID=117010 RepID=A0A8H5M8G6_9AGAR|nr:hypothetical protein D9615_000973 [Tricholomella constricta]
MSAATIKITYELNPPPQTVKDADNLSTSKTQTFPVNANPADGQEKYYSALQKAIAGAKDQLGNELTVWRDAVGKAELSKETPKTLKYDAGEEEDEEESEQ